MSSLDFNAFKPTAQKIKVIEFHPVQPWVVMADVEGTVTVWDWSTQQVVHEMQLAIADESLLQDAMLQRLAEKDPAYYGPQLSAGMQGTKSAASGAVRDLHFLDTETCFWQIALQHQLQYNAASGGGIPHLGRVRGLKGHRWLVIACETKILMFDLVSNVNREVPRTLLDGKAPTRTAFLFAHSPLLLGYGAGESNSSTIITPVLAVGTSGGVVYLLSVATLQIYAKLTGGHKSNVTAMLAMASKRPGGPDALISASVDGTVAVWEPSASAPKGLDKELAPKATFKAHDSGVLSMVFFQTAADSPDAGPMRLLTSGDDKKLAVWDTATWKEVSRAKPLAKGSCHSVAYSPRAGGPAAVEPCLLLSSEESPVIYGMYPSSGNVVQVASVEQLLPAGSKKVPKVYQMACHPLLPHLVALGANSGFALLSFDSHTLPAVAPLPLQLPTSGDIDSPPAGAASGPEGPNFKGPSYLTATGNNLWHVAFRQLWREEPGMRLLTTERILNKKIAPLNHTGRPVVAVSSSGRCCSVVWPDAGEYAIYSQTHSGDWDKLDAGTGLAVAWAANTPTYAVIYQPKAAVPTAGKISKKKSKAKEQEAAHSAAVASAQAAAVAATVVQVFEVDEARNTVKVLAQELPTASDRPIGLHGGALLGVTYSRSIKQGSRRTHAMQLFSWKSFEPVGELLCEPKWLAWDPDVTVAALAYADGITLCRTRPAFRAFATLPLQEATSGVWHRHQLIVATHTALSCAFVAAGDPGGQQTEPFLEMVRIASLAGGVVSQLAAGGDPTAALPAESMRCAGPVVVIGMREGGMWLVDSRGQPFVIPVLHAGLRARCLAAHGDLTGARAVAERGLWRTHHDEMAQFIAAMAAEGSGEAASMTGLSLQAELGLSLRSGQLRRALHCLEALARGAGDRGTLNGFPRWHQHVIDDGGTSPGWSMKGSPGMSSFRINKTGPLRSFYSLDAGAFVPVEPAHLSTPAATPDTIDWDAPLKEAITAASQRSAPALPATTRPSTPPSDAAPAPQASTSSASATQLTQLGTDGLALVDAALAGGNIDIASRALKLLLPHAAGLPPEQLASMLLRSAQCGLTAELHAFAASLKGRAGPQADIASLVALLQDDTSIAQATLQSTGLTNLAAIYANAWRSTAMPQALLDWGARLTAVSGHGAAVIVQPPK
ncbi:hypothetical protein WJX72_000101 [[Myrmecia] bisecta]|uniref:Uncharacterized protein n=1 Tax=[Myrmecia] bisecta TaxID=41462 RepID=A0AAW1QDY2_9CHLO